MKKNTFNVEQQKVVDKTDGPVQVVAGAGSGKTTVLMGRTENIIEKGTQPSNILLVTFTKKAANELKERLVVKIGDIGKEVNAGTFHSICLQRILKRYADEDFLAEEGLGDRWESMDQKDQSKLIRQSLKEMPDEDKEYQEENGIKPKNFESFLSLVRSMGVRRQDYRSIKQDVVDNNDIESPLFWINDYLAKDGIKDFQGFEDVALRFWERYEQLCRSKNAIDFDDILALSCRLVESRPDIARKLGDEWKYIMLDEYQDTNIVQMRIMDAIAEEHQNICVVGDDQQSIYAFRGSNIGVIRGFKDRYPDTEMLTLTYNYRSTAEILLTSNRIAGAMPNRLSDEFLKTPLDKHNDKPKLRGFNSDYDEAKWIANDIAQKLRNGENADNIAILYRNRSVKMSIERHFLDLDLPYMIYGDTSFFDRKEVQDTVAMIRFVFRPWSALSAVRFMDASNLPITGELVQKNADKYGISPHQYLTEFSEPANHMLGDKTLDTEEDKKKRYYNQVLIVRKNVNKLSELNEQERMEKTPKVLNQLDAVNAKIKTIVERINDGTYPQNSMKKNDIEKSGVAVRKVIKELKKETPDWNKASEQMDETCRLMKSSVNKSNQVRLFIDTMEAISDTAKICDIPGVDKSVIRSLPKVFRDALASTWETYMASKLEEYTKNRISSEGDHNTIDNNLKNVEYILDRFSEKIDEAIVKAENDELPFSEIIDVAIDDIVTLIDQAPEENEHTKVQMMTMHASKGLEFPHVYVMGMTNDIMPGKEPEKNPMQTEEELRLFYVAATRAQEHLSITYSMKKRTYSGNQEATLPSMFLQNITDVVDYIPSNSEDEYIPIPEEVNKNKQKHQTLSM